MQFLRTLFWVVLAAIAAVFATRNWTNVSVILWGGFAADAKLPVLLLIAFLLGLLPTLIVQRARQWRLQRRLAEAERLNEPPREVVGAGAPLILRPGSDLGTPPPAPPPAPPSTVVP